MSASIARTSIGAFVRSSSHSLAPETGAPVGAVGPGRAAGVGVGVEVGVEVGVGVAAAEGVVGVGEGSASERAGFPGAVSLFPGWCPRAGARAW